MSPELIEQTGRTVRTGRLLGKGGQGSVYDVAGRPDVVAKIFHQPVSREQAQKLALMTGLSNPQILKIASWPMATLHARSPADPVLGFVMPRIAGYQEIHSLHGPKSRLATFPQADWRFLIHVAANASRAMANLHQIGVVMGDVNDRNVLVSQQSLVRLIDCDSFQVTAGGRVFLCPVGVGTHTPPELQGKALDQTPRTANHDVFGLAVLIFQLLFMGRHPFSGRFLGRGEQPSIEQAIAEGRFAYGTSAGQRQMSPPPHTLPLEALPPEFDTLFRRAFTTPAGERPTAAEWTQALTRLQAATIACRNIPAHQYLNTLTTCPWCQIERQAGILLFLTMAAASGTLPAGLDLDRVWSRIAAIRPPEPLPILTAELPGVQAPSLRVAALGRARRRRRIITAGITGTLVVLCLANSRTNWFLVVVAVIVVAVAIVFDDWQDQSWKQAREAAETALHLAEGREDALWKHWNGLGTEQFAQHRADLEAKARSYRDLPQRRVRELQALERDGRARQLHRYLDLHRIDLAPIKDIGPTRRATLQSFGIETAADITAAALASLPGFGPELNRAIIDWRTSLERTFVYDARVLVDPGDIADLDRRLQQERAALERALRDGPETLQDTARRIVAARTAAKQDVIEAVRLRRQAEADVYVL